MLTPRDGLEWIGADAWDNLCGIVDTTFGTTDYVTPADEMAWMADENSENWIVMFSDRVVNQAMRALRARRNL